VNCIGVDDRIVESICNGLFQRNQELYAEDDLNLLLSVICQEYKKLNRDMLTLTFGQQEIPPMAQRCLRSDSA